MEKESYDQRIKKLEQALKNARDERSKAAARRDVLEKDLESINKKIAEFGYKPEELETRIKEIRLEIESLLKQVSGLLPKEYLDDVGW
ncbi:MAG: hypothetical protein ACM3UZ_11055 [Acidobacteriota bacterium]